MSQKKPKHRVGGGRFFNKYSLYEVWIGLCIGGMILTETATEELIFGLLLFFGILEMDYYTPYSSLICFNSFSILLYLILH